MASTLSRSAFAYWLPVALVAATSCGPGGNNLPDDGSGGTSTSGTSGGGTAGTGLGGAAGVGAGGSGVGGTSAGGLGGTGFGGGAGGVSAGAAGLGGGIGGTAGSLQGGGAGAGAVGGGAAGGASGTGTGGAGGGAGGGKATGFLVETFESGTVGQQPPGWDNFIGYNRNAANPSGTTLALVDTAHAHGGTKSLHVHGGQQPAQLVRALPTGTTRLYVRAWVFMSRQLGMNPGANHETLFAIRKTPGDVNNEVRFGEIKGVIGTNETPSDNISPKMDRWGLGPVVPANSPACIEVAFLGDLPTHELHAWSGGTLVHEVTSSGTDQWQNGAMPSATWMSGKFTEAVIGWQSFSGIDIDLWLDDVIFSTSPIGCN